MSSPAKIISCSNIPLKVLTQKRLDRDIEVVIGKSIRRRAKPRSNDQERSSPFAQDYKVYSTKRSSLCLDFITFKLKIEVFFFEEKTSFDIGL